MRWKDEPFAPICMFQSGSHNLVPFESIITAKKSTTLYNVVSHYITKCVFKYDITYFTQPHQDLYIPVSLVVCFYIWHMQLSVYLHFV